MVAECVGVVAAVKHCSDIGEEQDETEDVPTLAVHQRSILKFLEVYVRSFSRNPFEFKFMISKGTKKKKKAFY